MLITGNCRQHHYVYTTIWLICYDKIYILNLSDDYVWHGHVCVGVVWARLCVQMYSRWGVWQVKMQVLSACSRAK